jgi:hypothetical protein
MMGWFVGVCIAVVGIIYIGKRETKMKEKIYCRNCRYFYSSSMYGPERCCAPKNLEFIKDTYLNEEYKYILEPGVKNAHNDCEDFEWVCFDLV